MKIIPLGSGGWIPTISRQTSTFLIEADNKLILLDAGTGVHNLREYSDIINSYNEVDIILSHYHLDHIIGLSYLPLYLKDKKITVWGPGEKYYGRSSEKILNEFTNKPFSASSIKDFAREVYIKDYDEAGFMIGSMKIGINKQIHSDPSFGITISNYLHYATDTEVLDISFQKDCEIILHECWTFSEESYIGHSSLDEIKSKAHEFQVKKLGLIHLNPRYSEKEINEINDNNIFVVQDNKEIILLEDKA